MIVVLADDLSGAAEIAGVAVEQGRTAEVQTCLHAPCTSDVLVLDTQTRTKPAKCAAEQASTILQQVLQLAPEWIYKKVDSVLRGSVGAELAAMLACRYFERSLLLPANPSKQRTIQQGQLLVDRRPLDQTIFAQDPDHPRRTAFVAQLLDCPPDVPVRVGATELSGGGIHVPDIVSEAELDQWARRVDSETLPAGGADFFRALLRVRSHSAENARETVALPEPKPRGATLLVCGSQAAWASGRALQAAQRGIPVTCLPESLRDEQRAEVERERWSHEIQKLLDQHATVLVAIGRSKRDPRGTPRALAEQLAQAVRAVLHGRSVSRLLLEGGETASACLGRLKWTRFRALRSPHPGLALLVPWDCSSTQVFIKPGSYQWPEGVWPS